MTGPAQELELERRERMIKLWTLGNIRRIREWYLKRLYITLFRRFWGLIIRLFLLKKMLRLYASFLTLLVGRLTREKNSWHLNVMYLSKLKELTTNTSAGTTRSFLVLPGGFSINRPGSGGYDVWNARIIGKFPGICQCRGVIDLVLHQLVCSITICWYVGPTLHKGVISRQWQLY